MAYPELRTHGDNLDEFVISLTALTRMSIFFLFEQTPINRQRSDCARAATENWYLQVPRFITPQTRLVSHGNPRVVLRPHVSATNDQVDAYNRQRLEHLSIQHLRFLMCHLEVLNTKFNLISFSTLFFLRSNVK